MEKKYTQKQICRMINRRTDVRIVDVQATVRELKQIFKEVLKKGDKISFRELGTFYVDERDGHKYYDFGDDEMKEFDRAPVLKCDFKKSLKDVVKEACRERWKKQENNEQKDEE